MNHQCRKIEPTKATRFWILFSVLLSMLTSVASGQSRLIFPRLSYEEGTLTGVALLNPNDTSAMVTLTAYDSGGQVIETDGLENPHQITIEPGRQFADLTSSLFGTLPPDTVGWFEATSPSSDLTGFFLFLDFPDFTFFDGADLPRGGVRLVFPEIRLATGFSTEINLINPGDEAATVQLTLQGGETSVRPSDLQIPARGVIRMDVTEAFSAASPAGVGAFPDPAILRVVSNQPVAGFALVRQGEGDLLGLNAVPMDEQLNRLYFPQLAVGEIVRTELSLDNLSGRDTLVTLTAHREDGELFAPGVISTNPVSLALQAGQVLRLDMAETFGFVGNEVRQGWLEVAATTEALHGALSYSLPGTGSLAAVATSRQGNRQAALSHLATDAGFFTGLALLNSASLATDVRIVAISRAGEILGTATRTLAPGERMSQLLGVDLIPEAAGQSGGAVYVRSSVPIFLTSLFGRLQGSGVLANIAAQLVPSTYRPDQALPQARVSPPLAAVEPGGSLSFTLQTEGQGVPTWRVNGVVGGGAQVGTIGANGNFVAPTDVPMRLPVSITAEIDDQTASASVDVVSRQTPVSGPGLVQSVAYLESLSRLYVVELGVASASTATAPQAITSAIVDVTGGGRTVIREIPGEDVSKILAYRQADGTESLLVAGRGTGQIYRLAVDEPFEIQVIASGLNAPEAMTLDSGSGDLIVAESDKLSRIPVARLSADSASPQGGSPGAISLLEAIAPQGVAVDSCTGDILFSDSDARSIRRLNRGTGEVTSVVELTNPTQLVGVSRSGVSCPDGFHLFVAEPLAERVTRVVPEQGFASLYALTPGVLDMAFLPSGDLLAAEQAEAGGRVEQLFAPDIYRAEAINPPALSSCIGDVEVVDPKLDAAIRQALELGPMDPIRCDAAESLTALTAENQGISRLDGLEAFVNLETLGLDRNQINDIAPLAGLTNLQGLSLSRNQISDISPLAELTNLQSLSLLGNQLGDISSLAGLVNLQDLVLFSNQISDLAPLAPLTNLQLLQIEGNQISDISPLAALTNLRIIGLGQTGLGNPLSDITALGGLTKLDTLLAIENQISDISPLAGLTNLQTLILDGNQISDISSLAGLTNLTLLRLDNNQVNDIGALAGLTNLQALHLPGNQISDISSLAALTNLTFLRLDGNQISDISPLAGLTNLPSLTLSANQISDIAPLAGLTNLHILLLNTNQISDIGPLVGLVNLETLFLDFNQISDIGPLAGLINIRLMYLHANQISDIAPLAGLANLRTLRLNMNQISDIAPLVANMGLGAGDSVQLIGNPLDAGDCGDINSLTARGVYVDIAASLCP